MMPGHHPEETVSVYWLATLTRPAPNPGVREGLVKFGRLGHLKSSNAIIIIEGDIDLIAHAVVPPT